MKLYQDVPVEFPSKNEQTSPGTMKPEPISPPHHIMQDHFYVLNS